MIGPTPPPGMREVITTTVLWADLDGFGARLERLGFAAFADFIDTYYRVAADAVRANGGVHDNFMGDAVLAYFESAERAQRAAAQLRDAVAAALPGTRVRIGIATGEVIRGTFGPDWHQTRTAFGAAINHAAASARADRAPSAG